MSKKNETKLNQDKKIEEIEKVEDIQEKSEEIEKVEDIQEKSEEIEKVEDIIGEVEEDLKENNTENIPKEVKFENPNVQAEEVEKIPDYFVSQPKSNKEALFGVKNGRTYKKIDEFTGVYTDTGEGFDLRK